MHGSERNSSQSFLCRINATLKMQAQSCTKRACPLRFLLDVFNIIIAMSLASYQMKEDF